jgi:Tol biopolymer transport system component
VTGRRHGSIAVAAASAALAVAGLASASYPGRNGRIAVVDVAKSVRHYATTVNPDGSEVRAFALGTAAETIAASPDGRRLAFSRQYKRRGSWATGIFVADATGHGAHRIVDEGQEPAWAPDGRRLVYHGRAGIYTTTVAGHQQRALRGAQGPDVSRPRWSPDDRQIAFLRSKGRVTELVSVGGGGGRLRVLYHPPFKEGFVDNYDWSPDGRFLVLTVVDATAEAGGGWMSIIRSDGSGARRLTRNAFGHVSWSPDGRLIAAQCLSSPPAVEAGICTLDTRGRHLRRVLGSDHGDVRSITWFPRPRRGSG